MSEFIIKGNIGEASRPRKRFWGKAAAVFLAILASGLCRLESAGAEEVRRIKIIAAASPNFRLNPRWRREIFERIAFANKIFEPQFGIRFSIKEYAFWNPRGEMFEPAGRVPEDFRALAPHQAADEIVMGFDKLTKPLGVKRSLVRERIGAAAVMQGVVVIRDPFDYTPPLVSKNTVAHELAHVFGANHVADETTIMYPKVSKAVKVCFDEANARIIRAARNMDFRKGPLSLSGEALETIGRVLRESPGFIQDGNFITHRRNLESIRK